MSKWHTSYLNVWKKNYYKGVIGVNDVVSPLIVKKVFEQNIFGRELEITGDDGLDIKYYADEEIIKQLPIRVLKYENFHYKQHVFRLITKYQKVNIVDEKYYTYHDYINMLANYSHSRTDYQTLSKIIITSAYFDKVNARIISKAAFGKDSLVNIMGMLVGDTSKIVNPTIAKLKYRLINKVIILNETGGLSKDDANRLGQFLLAVGDFSPEWENDTRAKNGTKEKYQIEDNSFLIFHNIKDYYTKKNMSYFDEQFTPAVQDRFKGLLMQGMVTEDFTKVPEQDEQFNEQLVKMVRTSKWFMSNSKHKRKYKQNVDFNYTGLERQRCKRNIDTITKWIDRYSQTQDEYDDICRTLSEAKMYG